MIKNVGISEGGKQRGFTPAKLRTNLQGGGTCDWVPEEGTRLITKRIDRTGTYKAEDDEAYGYSVVTVTGVIPSGGANIRDKVIIANGRYNASDEDLYGYDKVTVAVPGGAPKPNDDINPGPSSDPGSSVVAEDPVTGDDVKVEVDEDGNLDESTLAHHIRIDILPTQIDYYNGQPINLTGIVVRGFLKDGTPYKNASLTDSVIPFAELSCNPLFASSEGGTPSGTPVHYNSGQSVRIDATQNGKNIYRSYEVYSGAGPFYVFGTLWYYADSDETGIGGFICSPNSFIATAVYFNGNREQTSRVTSSNFTYQGQTVYYAGMNAYQSRFDPSVDAPINDLANFGTPGESPQRMVAWNICFDPYVYVYQTVTVIWPREGDKKELTDEFQIGVIVE